MRFVSAQTLQAWLSSWKGGATQPMIRATIDPFLLETVPYDASQIATTYTQTASGTKVRSKPRNVRGVFAIGVFNPGRVPKELPNIRDVSWDTSIDTDAATMKMTLWNTTPLPIGQTPADDYTFDLPGYFSPGRGAANEPAEWGNSANEWQGMLAPDRLIRLYAGYGWDATVAPEKDPHLYPAGLWLIDEVIFKDDATIEVTCRDLARLMMEQICMPPVISTDEYPISWTTYGTGTTSSLSTVAQAALQQAQVVTTTASTTTPVFGWVRPTYATSSNDKYIGHSITDSLGRPIVAADGAVSGHYARQAFDSDVNSFWLSVGAIYATVPRFVEGTFAVPQNVGAVRIKTWGGPYNIWVSLQINGVWQGPTKIPYTAGQDWIVTDAVIPYVKWATVAANATTDVGIPVNTDGSTKYNSVTRIRVTFTALKAYGTGNANLRAGAYDIQVSATPASAIPQTTVGGTTGATPTSQSLVTVSPENIGDLSDPVKWFAGWAGFAWPGGSSGHNTLTYADGTSDSIPGPAVGDPIFPPTYRIWGDIEEAGTSPVAPLPISQFDKRPLADGAAGIRDTLGFISYISELGGFVFRSPNIWEVGNFVYPIRANEVSTGPANLGRTTDIIDLKDDETILAMSTTLSGHNTREKVVVGDVTGALGATANLKPNNKVGPFASGMRRTAAWSDQHWGTASECLITAELIMLRQSFTFRTTKITIPANPSIQIDDQVRVWDRLSATTYLYYVSGISSQFDMRSGKWTYDLTAHWLGTDPFTEWAFSAGDLSTDTRSQLGANLPTTPTGGTGTTTTGTPAAVNYGWVHTTATSASVDALAAQYSISSTSIHTLNPKLGAAVGPHYWVKVRTNYGPVVTAHETVYASYGWFQSLSNSNTVTTVANVYGITVNSLRSMNQWLTGNTVPSGYWVQVRTTADQLRTS